MKAKLTLIVELLEPALIRSVDDLIGLDPAQIRRVSLRLDAVDVASSGIEAALDAETTNLSELIAFARSVQDEPTLIELWFHGRAETLEL